MRPIFPFLSLIFALPAMASELPAGVTPAAKREAASADAPDTAERAEVRERSSYALGFRTGGQFFENYGNFGIRPEDIEPEVFLKGFLDASKGAEPQLGEEELASAMQALGDLLQEREEEVAAANLKEGEAFLAGNAERDGVVTTASGLQYEVVVAGDGERYEAPPEGQPDKQFEVRYTGSKLDGSVFDSTGEESIVVGLDVIAGMREALTLMPAGSTWKLFIPPHLAYGESRRSLEIGPSCTLIFEVELVAIEDAPGLPGNGLPLPPIQDGAGGD